VTVSEWFERLQERARILKWIRPEVDHLKRIS